MDQVHLILPLAVDYVNGTIEQGILTVAVSIQWT